MGQVILIVTADPLMRHMAAEGLVEAGYHVINVAGLRQAHAALESHRNMGLVIVDLDFPDCGGIALADAARATRPDLPILFITNRDEDVDESRLDLVLAGFREPFGVMALFDAREALKREYPDLDGYHDGVDLEI